MSFQRVTFSGCVSVIVHCEDCGWKCFRKNGVGLAAQHCDRYGHTVHVETANAITFTPRGSVYDVARGGALEGDTK